MKRPFLILLIIPFMFSSCIRSYVKVAGPPSSQTVAVEPATGYYIVNGSRYYPLPDALGFVETGKASWYGDAFQGRPTSSGETYDMYKRTAAHKTLPLGTYVKIINLENNESTIVRINDRGPFVKGRIIDLSYGAAKDIHMDIQGLAEVKVIALGKEIGDVASGDGLTATLDIKGFQTGEFTVQAGAFKDRNNALRLAERLRQGFGDVHVVEYTDKDDQVFFRVHVGRTSELAGAGEIERRLEKMGFKEAFVLRI